MRLINQVERKTINRVLKDFGFSLIGGSSELRQDGMIVYHLCINKGPARNFGKMLGFKLREALGADAVYNMGVLL